MYPFLRMGYQLWRHRSDPPLGVFETHESRHVCWPWDIDIWMELNNGRALTLFDLGRIPWFGRIGLSSHLRAQGWGVVVAGSTPRYRRRIRCFDRLTMKTRAIGWDARFFYAEQGMWLADGTCANHNLIRSAITDRNGIVPPERLIALMDDPPDPRPLPAYAQAWIDADAQRPWPPMQDG